MCMTTDSPMSMTVQKVGISHIDAVEALSISESFVNKKRIGLVDPHGSCLIYSTDRVEGDTDKAVFDMWAISPLRFS